jgi:uncharacterized SAM-binding protein YcdF (DUF218 family)
MRLFVAAAVVAALLVVFHRPVLRAAGRFLIVDDAPVHADAIVVLAGSIPDRILHGADLYREGFAPLLVLTRDVEAPGLAELRRRGMALPERYQLNVSIAEQLGVPRGAILVMDRRAGSTIGEMAVFLSDLERRGIRSVLVVTSKTHTRRSAMIFSALAGDTMQVRLCPTPYDPFSPDDWWRHRAIARRVVTEYLKILVFNLLDRWRAAYFEAQPEAA